MPYDPSGAGAVIFPQRIKNLTADFVGDKTLGGTNNVQDSIDRLRLFKNFVRVVSTTALPANSYSSGVLTASTNGALGAIDGVTLALNDRVLLTAESTGSHNGIYIVTQLGDASNPWKLTRAADMNTTAQTLPMSLIPVSEGTSNKNTLYALQTAAPIVLDTTSLTFGQVSGSGGSGSSSYINIGKIVTITETSPGSNVYNLPYTGLGEMVWVGEAIQVNGSNYTVASGNPYTISFTPALPSGVEVLATSQQGGIVSANSYWQQIGTGDGATTVFTLPGSGLQEQVIKGGAPQKRGVVGDFSSGDYYISGTSQITFFAAPASGAAIMASCAVGAISSSDASSVSGHAAGNLAGDLLVLDSSALVPSVNLPAATEFALGAVKQGTGVTIASDGTLSAASSGNSFLNAVAQGQCDANCNGTFLQGSGSSGNILTKLQLAMNSDTTPSPYVASASSEYWPAYQAFDGTTSVWGANGTSGWVAISLGSAYTFVQYTVQSYSDPNYQSTAPKNWTFEGSNDGTTWTVLDTQTNQTGWTANQVRTFSFTNSTGYSHYRLNISANNGYNLTYVSELGLYYNVSAATSVDALASSTYPLQLVAADGLGNAGPEHLWGPILTNNATGAWGTSNLTANRTNYLYADINDASYLWGATTKAPIVQPTQPATSGTSSTDVIPAMTSNTTPSGTVSASTYAGSDVPWLAVDDQNTGNGWFANATTGWWQYQFPSAEVIVQYNIWGHPSSTYITNMPKTWTFEGSNDGSTWTTLDTRTSETGWTVSQVRTYSFTNTTGYTYYRINITANNGGASYVTIPEIEMFAAIDITNTDWYNNITGETQHYDGTAWTKKHRVYLGFCSVDGSGNVSNVNAVPVGLSCGEQTVLGATASPTTTTTSYAGYVLPDPRATVSVGIGQVVSLEAVTCVYPSTTALMYGQLMRSADGGSSWTSIGTAETVETTGAYQQLLVNRWTDNPPPGKYVYAVAVWISTGTLTAYNTNRSLTAKLVRL